MFTEQATMTMEYKELALRLKRLATELETARSSDSRDLVVTDFKGGNAKNEETHVLVKVYGELTDMVNSYDMNNGDWKRNRLSLTRHSTSEDILLSRRGREQVMIPSLPNQQQQPQLLESGSTAGYLLARFDSSEDLRRPLLEPATSEGYTDEEVEEYSHHQLINSEEEEIEESPDSRLVPVFRRLPPIPLFVANKYRKATICYTSLFINFVFCLTFIFNLRKGDNHQCSGQPLRSELVTKCALTLSGVQKIMPKSPQQKAVDYFLNTGSEIKIPERCSWDSDFGQIYSLIVFRESLGVQDDSWYSSPPDRKCNWQRISCGGQGEVTTLTFNHANLVGCVPEEIAGLVHLEDIKLFSNPGVTGLMPSKLGQLQKLKSLQIHQTSVFGKIPSELGDLSSLERLLMDHTLLTGTVPQEICELVSLKQITAPCHGDNATVTCSCCSNCPHKSDMVYD